MYTSLFSFYSTIFIVISFQQHSFLWDNTCISFQLNMLVESLVDTQVKANNYIIFFYSTRMLKYLENCLWDERKYWNPKAKVHINYKHVYFPLGCFSTTAICFLLFFSPINLLIILVSNDNLTMCNVYFPLSPLNWHLSRCPVASWHKTHFW